MFYFLRYICSTSLLRSLYYAFIYFRLQYGIACWGGTYKNLIDKLRVTQNFFMRIILRKSAIESSFPLYEHLKVLPIQHLFVYTVLKIFYIKSGNRGNDNLYYDTRRVLHGFFRLPKVNKVIFRRSILYLGPKLFNQLRESIRNLNIIKHFCLKVLGWLSSQCDSNYNSAVVV